MAAVPANAINESTTGITGFTGTSFVGTPVTQYNVITGASTSSTLNNVAPSATSGVPLISQGSSSQPIFGTAVVAGGGTGATTLTAHGVLLGEGTSPIVATSVGTNGQVLLGSTGADPAFGTLTSSDGSITFTTGANSLGLKVTGGSTVGQTITGNDSVALSPTAGNWNIVGTGSITTSGSSSTLTAQLTGLTNHNVLVGAGSATITKVAPSATSGIPLISQGSSSDPVFGTVGTAGGGTGLTGTPSNGQLLIGNGAGYTLSTLTAGTNVTISNASGSITINATGGGGLMSASGTLTSAQIKALHGTPVQAIAAPGAGKVIVVSNTIAHFIYGGSNAFTAGASQTIEVYYGTATNVAGVVTPLLKTATITATSDQFCCADGSTSGMNTLNTAYTNVVNTPVNFYNSVSSEITGNAANNNSIAWEMQYTIVTI